MAEKFKSGDIVQLRSGGPVMTVVEYGTFGTKPKYQCRWFGDNARATPS
jgi:uncharacterized protein YodC (DUF2158 family)